ncbi:hypothetical protein N7507_004931 [Penicillium longicatenatum]|nr:hypothetical protein N7507_004931 [Penicillium longicatenatum]
MSLKELSKRWHVVAKPISKVDGLVDIDGGSRYLVDEPAAALSSLMACMQPETKLASQRATRAS